MECLKEDIPPRYHKYIPRSYSGRSSQDSDCRSNISTVHLPLPTASHTSGANRFNPNQQLESTSAAEPPSYRSRSNVQVSRMLPNIVCPRIIRPKCNISQLIQITWFFHRIIAGRQITLMEELCHQNGTIK